MTILYEHHTDASMEKLNFDVRYLSSAVMLAINDTKSEMEKIGIVLDYDFFTVLGAEVGCNFIQRYSALMEKKGKLGVYFASISGFYLDDTLNWSVALLKVPVISVYIETPVYQYANKTLFPLLTRNNNRLLIGLTCFIKKVISQVLSWDLVKLSTTGRIMTISWQKDTSGLTYYFLHRSIIDYLKSSVEKVQTVRLYEADNKVIPGIVKEIQRNAVYCHMYTFNLINLLVAFHVSGQTQFRRLDTPYNCVIPSRSDDQTRMYKEKLAKHSDYVKVIEKWNSATSLALGPRIHKVHIYVQLSAMDFKASLPIAFSAMALAAESLHAVPSTFMLQFHPVLDSGDSTCDILFSIDAMSGLRGPKPDAYITSRNPISMSNTALFSADRFRIPMISISAYGPSFRNKNHYRLLTRMKMNIDDVDEFLYFFIERILGWRISKALHVALSSTTAPKTDDEMQVIAFLTSKSIKKFVTQHMTVFMGSVDSGRALTDFLHQVPGHARCESLLNHTAGAAA
ncbi:hypothetical protein Ciccas_003185 [Cichlidogyrus casuarinus]|uniref:Uncharacterized protein n=1 Tax=Cichlidogyrus casuarinus TaxID=1844966 RepID=A0ABD2QF40_9PLAT